MKQTNKLFQKEFSIKFPLSAIDRKTIVLLTGFILLITCTITGCGSNSQQQSTLPVTEPIPIENPAQEESTQQHDKTGSRVSPGAGFIMLLCYK